MFHKSLCASEGPRATMKKRHLRTVGRGPVPRHASVYQTIAGDRPPRYGNGTFSSQKAPLTVGRGPVPRRAPVYQKPLLVRRTFACTRNPPIAGETRSDARVASEGPRATMKKRHLRTVGRGPVPRHASVYQTIAGDRPPRYGNGTFSSQKAPLTVGRGPVPRHAFWCQTVSPL